jgi:hypothetical protein
VAQLERNLRLTYAQRLDQLVRTVAFIQTGRAALARELGRRGPASGPPA